MLSDVFGAKLDCARLHEVEVWRLGGWSTIMFCFSSSDIGSRCSFSCRRAALATVIAERPWHQNLRRVRRDFATLLQEIFGEQAEKDICFEGRCGDAFAAIIQGRGVHVCEAVSKILRASPC